MNLLLTSRGFEKPNFTEGEYVILINAILEAGANPNLPGYESIFRADSMTLPILVQWGADLRSARIEFERNVTFLDQILKMLPNHTLYSVQDMLMRLELSDFESVDDFEDLDDAYQTAVFLDDQLQVDPYSPYGIDAQLDEFENLAERQGVVNGVKPELLDKISFSNPHSVICRFAECFAVYDQRARNLTSNLLEHELNAAHTSTVPYDVANLAKQYVGDETTYWTAQPLADDVREKLCALGRKVIEYKRSPAYTARFAAQIAQTAAMPKMPSGPGGSAAAAAGYSPTFMPSGFSSASSRSCSSFISSPSSSTSSASASSSCSSPSVSESLTSRSSYSSSCSASSSAPTPSS